jgi:hypothetical protein
MAAKVAPTLPRTGEVRSPGHVWLMSIITLGVYAVVHHYLINRELRDFGVDVRPLASLLALFPGVLACVPALVTLWRTSERIGVAQETAGLVPSSNGPVGMIAIVFWLFAPYHQREVNRVWHAEP